MQWFLEFPYTVNKNVRFCCHSLLKCDFRYIYHNLCIILYFRTQKTYIYWCLKNNLTGKWLNRNKYLFYLVADCTYLSDLSNNFAPTLLPCHLLISFNKVSSVGSPFNQSMKLCQFVTKFFKSSIIELAIMLMNAGWNDS